MGSQISRLEADNKDEIVATVSLVAVWWLYFKFVQRLSGYNLSKGWSENIVSLTHCITVIAGCLFYLIQNYPGYVVKYIIMFSNSYFLYDLSHHKISSMYFFHHVASLIIINKIFRNENGDCALKYPITGYMAIEIGNIPLYMIYALMKILGLRIFNRFRTRLLQWQFIWCLLFRVIAVSYCAARTKNTNVYISNGILQMMNMGWLITLGRKIAG